VIGVERVARRITALNDYRSGIPAQLFRARLGVVTAVAERREFIEVRKRFAAAVEWGPMIDCHCRFDEADPEARFTERMRPQLMSAEALPALRCVWPLGHRVIL
jgi:hypothetical protein